MLINRLWLLHFGEGLVSTADNFGHKGARPSHPELLDWLATEFVDRGWSIKAMHRLMLTSSAYRQMSVVTAEGKRADPENHLVWRQRFRRMEAEVLRDSVLSVAGSLNTEMYGPPILMQRNGDEIVAPTTARIDLSASTPLAAADAVAGVRPACHGDQLHTPRRLQPWHRRHFRYSTATF